MQVRGPHGGRRPCWEKQAAPERERNGPVQARQFLGGPVSSLPSSGPSCLSVSLGHFGKESWDNQKSTAVSAFKSGSAI